MHRYSLSRSTMSIQGKIVNPQCGCLCHAIPPVCFVITGLQLAYCSTQASPTSAVGRPSVGFASADMHVCGPQIQVRQTVSRLLTAARASLGHHTLALRE